MPERKHIVKPNTTESKLFSGSPGFLGGLSNENELATLCPEEFKKDNPWSKYAMTLFYQGGNIKNWDWKSDDQELRNKQLGCFKGLLGSFISTEDKEAVAGWMLSEMVSKVPEYQSPKKEAAKKRPTKRK